MTFRFCLCVFLCSNVVSSTAQSYDEQKNAIEATIVEKTCPDGDCMGQMSWSDGSHYEGAMNNGLREGFGKMTYSNGDVYEGEWKDDHIGTEGALMLANGEEYVGQFLDGEKNGEGSMIMADGSSYNGSWSDGKRDGVGELIRPDKSRFNGNFKEDQREGKGTIIWESGDTLSGIWMDGHLDGKSLFTFKNGDQLMCSWDKGNLNVRGSYRSVNGKEIKGTLRALGEEAEETFDLMSDTERNFQRAWLGFAMEFKLNAELDLAADFLIFAQQFTETENDFSQFIESELTQIQQELGTGFARLPLSKPN